MTNFLTIRDCVVVFTSPDLEYQIRALRPAEYPTIIIQQMARRIPGEKGVLLLQAIPFTEEEKTLTEGKSTADFTPLARLGGGTIGCDKESLDSWHKAFYQTVQNYLEEGRFMGKDQNMMATTCLESDMCLMVSGGDPLDWFRMQPWLRGEIDEDYTRLDVINQ